MTDFKITRRMAMGTVAAAGAGFIFGKPAVAEPKVKVANEFTIVCNDWPPIHLWTFDSRPGLIPAKWWTRDMEGLDKSLWVDGWQMFCGQHGKAIALLQVRSRQPDRLDVNWVRIVEPYEAGTLIEVPPGMDYRMPIHGPDA